MRTILRPLARIHHRLRAHRSQGIPRGRTLRHRPRDVPALLRTPVGRRELRADAFNRTWPLLSRLATVHRATLARHAEVIAVVGSLGKTTTTRAVATALGGDPDRLTRNFRSHLAAAVLRLAGRGDRAVLEVGISRPGEMARYARMVRPTLAVATWVGAEHHSSLGELSTTRDEKAAMVRALPASGMAVLNGDDPNVRWMGTQTAAQVTTYGTRAGNAVRATDVALEWPRGTRFTLNVNGTTRAVRLRLLGRQMVYPVLAAIAVALACGVDLDRALRALEGLAPTPGRLETVPLPGGALLIRDDQKATLATIDAALDVLAAVPAARRIVVLGDAEELSEDPHAVYARLGERVAAVAARAVFVHVYEDGPRYLPAAEAAGLSPAAVRECPGVLEAVEELRRELAAGDVVLVKGARAQRLERIASALSGRRVACDLVACEAKATACERCPMLERGWERLG